MRGYLCGYRDSNLGGDANLQVSQIIYKIEQGEMKEIKFKEVLKSTVVDILAGIKKSTFSRFHKNPEEFIIIISNDNVKYDVVRTYKDLLDRVMR